MISAPFDAVATAAIRVSLTESDNIVNLANKFLISGVMAH
jgi:hypothetical protein